MGLWIFFQKERVPGPPAPKDLYDQMASVGAVKGLAPPQGRDHTEELFPPPLAPEATIHPWEFLFVKRPTWPFR